MRLITRFELAAKSTNELKGCYKEVFNALARSKPDSPERRNAMASLENINREIGMRR